MSGQMTVDKWMAVATARSGGGASGRGALNIFTRWATEVQLMFPIQ
jgi:hypothetical protein